MQALQRAPSLPVTVPGQVVESLLAVRRFAAGLRRRVVRVRQFEIPYLEGGTGEPLVLVHGFSDNKDTFVDAARGLTPRFRVILPDLLGFGEASRPTDFTFDLPNWTEVFAETIDALGLDRFHLGGNSLGGAICALYALEHPERVRSLTLIGSAGVSMPRPSELQLQLERGRNPFCCDSFEGYQAFVRFVLERPPPIPYPVQRYLAEDFIARAPMHAKMMEDLVAVQPDLTPRLPQVRAPTLLLWGDRDRLIDLSAGRVFHRAVPRSELVILHGVGHCPQLEVPGRTAGLLRSFLASA